MALGVSFFVMLFHHGARGDFLRAFAVASGMLGAFLDVFVLALFLGADAAEMFSSWHGHFSCCFHG